MFESEGFGVKRYYRKDLDYTLVTLGKVGLKDEAIKKLDDVLKQKFAVWEMTLND